jgi:hypothetical protein
MMNYVKKDMKELIPFHRFDAICVSRLWIVGSS